MSTLKSVREFHDAFGVEVPEKPTIYWPTAHLRIDLLDEEVAELASAVEDEDIVGVLDALIDIQYVLDGAFLAFGLADVKEDAFAEVHRSNMSKLGMDGKPIYREDGKVLKGPKYSPPNLKQFFEEAA